MPKVRRIVEESHGKADRLLATHRDILTRLAEASLKAESLNQKGDPGGHGLDRADPAETQEDGIPPPRGDQEVGTSVAIESACRAGLRACLSLADLTEPPPRLRRLRS